MNNIVIRSPWIIGNLSLQPGKAMQISIVAYEHSAGMPARFCAGLIPAVEISRQLKKKDFESIVRVIDPTPIANYCNGWQVKQSQFRDVIADFFGSNDIAFFFDEAEQVSDGALGILSELGAELKYCADMRVSYAVQGIKDSGRKHGGVSGANNAFLYMAAHPFSWLDMHHPLIWKKSYPSEGHQFINLMSMAEERFAIVRRFLNERRPNLCTLNKPVDRYMTVCNIPCYIPLEGEPMFEDLTSHGYDWCCKRYHELETKSSKHKCALNDFEALMSFLEISRF